MEIVRHPINLTDEEWDRLELLSALDYSHDRIAVYFGIDKRVFNQVAKDENSYLTQRLSAGKIKQDIDERIALYELAADGDVPAQKQIFEVKRTKAFKISKMNIIGGFDNDGTLEKLMDFVQSGNLESASVEEQLYISALLFLKDMDSQYGRKATIEYAVKTLKINAQRASEMYSEALNLFYSDNNVTKAALRNKYADMIEAGALVVRENAVTSVDWKIHSEMIMQAAKLRELDKPDPEKLPNEVYQKSVRVFDLNATKAGLPAINRLELANELDDLNLPEAIKADLKQDALIDQLNIPAKLDRIIQNYNE